MPNDFAAIVKEAARREKEKEEGGPSPPASPSNKQQQQAERSAHGSADSSQAVNKRHSSLYLNGHRPVDSPDQLSLADADDHPAVPSSDKGKQRDGQGKRGASHSTAGGAEGEDKQAKPTEGGEADNSAMKGPFALQEKEKADKRPKSRSKDSSKSSKAERPALGGTRASSMFHTLTQRMHGRMHDDPLSEEEHEGEERDGNRPETQRSPSKQQSGEVDEKRKDSGPGSKWTALRHKIRGDGDGVKPSESFNKGLSGSELVRELGTGLLPTIMIKMSLMDRDEHGQHRIPVLMNYLKLRITDSVYPFHNTHALFRLELEYGDGLMKWVIYREMRDFVNLHAHYRVANFRNNIESMPDFPVNSLQYFNLSNKDGKKSRAEYAKKQRENLENYLLRLIRATMFLPQANRLCKFLEISALGLKLSTLGGYQGKQGYMRVMSTGISRKKKAGFHPLTIKQRHEPKWFIVRESYIVAVDEPDQTQPWEVFLIDPHFVIERPKRLYRATLNTVTPKLLRKNEDADATADAGDARPDDEQAEKRLNNHTGGMGDPNDPSTTDAVSKEDKAELRDASSHTFYITNAQARLKLVAKNERQMDQFIASIERMAKRTIWGGENRFGSFAPIRLNVACQWLVDGRDYFWSLSRAILLAKEKIYIHDWWLSPELYLRRPPGEAGKWRLDRLLKRKAEEGVKIFIIIYKEVSNDFTPVDSLHAKTSMLGLHPNITMQRSPSHAQTRTLLWSHHEKMCVIDETIAFMGGFDLCFGRWDTPQHTLVDEGQAGFEEADKVFKGEKVDVAEEDWQIWPGKDYSNQRVSDFHNLDKPEQDMYDRNRVPRQPWHDIGLQIIGQPARDLCRHFIMRWNYLLRTKNHTRFMPFLLPPPDFTATELEKKRIAGTCEAQICRSAGPWSMGTAKHVEHSIQTAYIKAIQLSDHLVYIENQFFVTSTVADGVVIENKIGHALVDRIIRAHHEGTPWRAIIIIPLVPGYPMPLDSPDAGSVRMIMECQNCSMFRGEKSIFGRLRREGISPEQYIAFFSLRSWGKFKSGLLATQDVYIHAKCMVVDDRIVVIGSANINERSQRGDRDSELACVIRDTDMIDSRMAGKPYKVGRFGRSLRIRLMREHLGVDTDAMESAAADSNLLSRPPVKGEAEQKDEAWDPDDEQEEGGADASQLTGYGKPAQSAAGDFKRSAQELGKGAGELAAQTGQKAVVGGAGSKVAEVFKSNKNVKGTAHHHGHGHLPDHGARHEEEAKEDKVAQSNAVPTIEEQVEDNDAVDASADQEASHRAKQEGDGGEETSIGTEDVRSVQSAPDAKSSSHKRVKSEGTATLRSTKTDSNNVERNQRSALSGKMSHFAIPTPAPYIDPNGFDDPLDDDFYNGIWCATASRNTQVYRKVFRCTPDDLCLTWGQFKEWDLWQKRHEKPARDANEGDPAVTASGGPGALSPDKASGQGHSPSSTSSPLPNGEKGGDDGDTNKESVAPAPPNVEKKRALKITDEGFTRAELEAMETVLEETRGNLVLFPTRFLESEDLAGNFLFARDRIQPMSIFN